VPRVREPARPRFGLRVLPLLRLGKMRLNGVAAPFVDRSSTRLPVLDERRRGTTFVELPVRTIVNSPESTGMGFWSINPYVGCEFGCTYCYARFAHRYVVERAWADDRITAQEFADLGSPAGLEPFEHRIFVKARNTVLAALDRDLALVRRRTARDGPQSLIIGTATDPYQPAERQYQLTRAILGRLCSEQGLRVGVITKSPLVARDIDLLRRLADRHLVSVYVSLISMDPAVIDRFEARSPLPHTRLRALGRLAAAGLRAGLIVAPILPGITDSSEQIRALMRAGRMAGAQFVFPSTLRLYPDVRSRLLPVVERHASHLAGRYRAAYHHSPEAPGAYEVALQRRFDRIAVEYGIPRTDGEREQPRVPAPDTQLSLFARSA
jgi:DNA repair photolyase